MTVPLQTLILIFLSHWVGDFLLQGNSIAAQKSVSLRWLTLHVLAYTASLFAFSFFVFTTPFAVKFTLLNGGLHFVTDLFTSKLSTKYKDNPRVFYPIIGLDQFIHISTLVASMHYLGFQG